MYVDLPEDCHSTESVLGWGRREESLLFKVATLCYEPQATTGVLVLALDRRATATPGILEFSPK